MKEALFYEKIDGNRVWCHLCPRECRIAPGYYGFCRARKNVGGKLYSMVYGKPTSVNVDPIEKKPFFHFNPGSKALSIGTSGCNFACPFCCNAEISQANFEGVPHLDFPVKKAIATALSSNCQGMSYTYNEPTIFWEYACDMSKLAKKNKLYNTFVTNGYINPDPIKGIAPVLDAAVIDLKGFNEKFYAKCGNVRMDEIMQAVKLYFKLGIWVELTNLVIENENDDPDDMRALCAWIKKNCSVDTPLHLIRFFPSHKYLDKDYTSIKSMEKLRNIARDSGLRYVYLGNVPGHEYENTYCYNCNELLVKRYGIEIMGNRMVGKKCPKCGKEQKFVGQFYC